MKPQTVTKQFATSGVCLSLGLWPLAARYVMRGVGRALAASGKVEARQIL